jgi:hypothetical protein
MGRSPKLKTTIPVAQLKAWVNKANTEWSDSPKIREGWNRLLEAVMKETGQYSGYGLLHEEEVPKGQLPAHRLHTEGPVDETRKIYY